jgi:hypothetical protein
MMANLLWQRYKWLGRGILEHEHRAIETLWGKIETAVGHHSELTQPVKYDALSVLTVTSGAPDSSEVNSNSVRLLEKFSGADIKVHSLDGISGLENEVARLVSA